MSLEPELGIEEADPRARAFPTEKSQAPGEAITHRILRTLRLRNENLPGVLGEVATAIGAAGAGLVPSSVLAGGLLTGKYRHATSGRMGATLDNPQSAAGLEVADRLVELAAELGHPAATLAVAFAAAHPLTASTLVGATRPDQLEQSAAGVELARSLEPDDLARLRAVGRRTD